VYILKFTDAGLEDVRALPKNVQNALRKELISKIRRDPVGCSRELQGPLEQFRSFHWRDYRVVYRIFPGQRVVAIVGIGRHSPDARIDIYRRLETAVSSGKLAETILLALRGFTEGKT
jgi:mRNA-degrading endonuclease RelE of RelBE toxin-antitoxin system